MTGENTPLKQDVRTRRVFYIPGYDPVLPRHYREIYRKEGAAQAAISGYRIAVKALTGRKNYSWQAEMSVVGATSEADVEFLLWSDIVQKSMDRNILATYFLLVRLIWIYVSTGALFRLARLRKGPVIAALYPIVSLLAQLVAACFMASLIGVGGAHFLPAFLSWSVAVAMFFWLMHWLRRVDRRFLAYYLLHDYAFSAQFYGANPPELEQRMNAFTADIKSALAGDCDEVLVVGHSSGAHIGVMVLADLLREHTFDKKGPKLAFLTLGQVVPMVSFLPRANRLRRDLCFLGQHPALTWVDVTAPGDGCSFALCNPVSVSGADPKGVAHLPLILSAAFTQSLSPDLLHGLRWRFFRLHFQYLHAFDRPKDYDYFQITAGPVSLGERYKDRTPSPSRIETSLSGYGLNP